MQNADSKIKLLWVEDETESGLLERKTHLELTDDYELFIERNASDGEKSIRENTFDKVIFDIRIPPGFDPKWEDIHNSKNNKLSLKLGLVLLERIIAVLRERNTPYGICTIERWQDVSETVLRIDESFNHEIQFLHKDDVVFPEDFEVFIQKIHIQ